MFDHDTARDPSLLPSGSWVILVLLKQTRTSFTCWLETGEMKTDMLKRSTVIKNITTQVQKHLYLNLFSFSPHVCDGPSVQSLIS